jgi:hypothetical protein
VSLLYAGGPLMLCDRCGQPIPAGEVEALPVITNSGPGPTVHVHRELCERPLPLAQTAPEPRVVIREP